MVQITACDLSTTGHNFNQCWIIVNWNFGTVEIQWNLNKLQVSYMKMNLKTSLAKWWPFCLDFTDLKQTYIRFHVVLWLDTNWGTWVLIYILPTRVVHDFQSRCSLFPRHVPRTTESSGCWRWTHWGRYKIDAILQTTFSNAISLIKMFEFRLKFHWSLFLRGQLTIFQHWSR